MYFRPTRLAAAFVRPVCHAALRAVVTGLVFSLCTAAVLSHMGVPLPDPRELPDWLEGVSRLAKILH